MRKAIRLCQGQRSSRCGALGDLVKSGLQREAGRRVRLSLGGRGTDRVGGECRWLVMGFVFKEKDETRGGLESWDGSLSYLSGLEHVRVVGIL